MFSRSAVPSFRRGGAAKAIEEEPAGGKPARQEIKLSEKERERLEGIANHRQTRRKHARRAPRHPQARAAAQWKRPGGSGS